MGLFFESVTAHYQQLPEIFSSPRDVFDQWFPNDEEDEELEGSNAEDELDVNFTEEDLTGAVSELTDIVESKKTGGTDREIAETVLLLSQKFSDENADVEEVDQVGFFTMRISLAQLMLSHIDAQSAPEALDRVIELLLLAQEQDLTHTPEHPFDGLAVKEHLAVFEFGHPETPSDWIARQTDPNTPAVAGALARLARQFFHLMQESERLQTSWTTEVGQHLEKHDMAAVSQAAAAADVAKQAAQKSRGTYDALRKDLVALLENKESDTTTLQAFVDAQTILLDGITVPEGFAPAKRLEQETPDQDQDTSDADPACDDMSDTPADTETTKEVAGPDTETEPDNSQELDGDEKARGSTEHQTGKTVPEDQPVDSTFATPNTTEPLTQYATDRSMDGTENAPDTIALDVFDTPEAETQDADRTEAASEQMKDLVNTSVELDTLAALISPRPDSDDRLGLYKSSLDAAAPAIGAFVSKALTQRNQDPDIREDAFLALSTARAVGYEYTEVIGMLTELVSQVQDPNEAEAAILFAAILKASIFAPSANMRPNVATLHLGSYGPHLSELQKVISELPYEFPQSIEQLTQISGTPTESKRTRILRLLETWMEETSQRSGHCQPSTLFLHTIVKPGGIVGLAFAAMASGAKNAPSIAREAADQIDGRDAIETGYRGISTPTGPRSATRLSPRTMDYMERVTSEAVGLLRAWADANEHRPLEADAKTKRSLYVLKGALSKAIANLDERIDQEDRDPMGQLRASVAQLIKRELTSISDALDGRQQDTLTKIMTGDDAAQADNDLLPPAIRRSLFAGNLGVALDDLYETGLPTLDQAYALNTRAGAFATAQRISKRLPGDRQTRHTALRKAQASLVATLSRDIMALSRRINTANRLDFKNQDRYPALMDWCDDVTQLLYGQGDKDALLQDFDAHCARSEDIAEILDTAEESIRDDQRSRVEDLRMPENTEDADAVLTQVDDNLGFEVVEDRIARLRDGKSIANIDEPEDPNDIIARFSPGFVEAVSSDGWPHTAPDYLLAFGTSGHALETPKDRAVNAAELMELFCDLREQSAKQTPKGKPIVSLLEALGFDAVKIAGGQAIQSARAWKYELRMRISHPGWFLPPVFGHRAQGLYRLIFCDATTLPEMLEKSLDSQIPTILLVSGRLERTRRYDFAKRMRSKGIPAVLIDETLVAYSAIRHETRLETVFACGLPYGRVEPYETNAGALPVEMFFGREEEIKRIISTDFEGCLVYGGRQLGKSALLAHVENIHHAPDNGIIVVRDQVTNLGLQDEPAARVWNKIHTMLSPFDGIVRPKSRDNPDAIRTDIKLWVTNTTDLRRVIVLLDETDEFISAEAMSGYPEITKLKDLMESTNRRFKIVFAGLHNVQSMHSTGNSPLPHLRTPTVIGPLNRTREDRQAAYELITEPLRAAGFRLETSNSVEKILLYTNEYPSLVQEFMSGLIRQRHLMLGRNYTLPNDGPLWVIPDEELFEHEGFSDIEKQIRKKFHLTLNLDVRYALVAYTLAHIAEFNREHALLDGMPARDILNEALHFWPASVDRLDAESFEVILEEMCDLGVLGKVDTGMTVNQSYCLRSPEVIPMLGTPTEIEEGILRIGDREPKPRYDRATHRRLVPSDSRDTRRRHYLPLTDIQVQRLLDRGNNAPRIICGLKMLGLERIPRFMERIAEDSSLPGVSPENPATIFCAEDQKTFRAQLDMKTRRPGEMRVVLFHHTGSAQDAERILGMASRRPLVTSGAVRPVLLLDAANPEYRNVATRDNYPMESLAPWGPDALRMHLRHEEATEFDKKDTRQTILDATGGVPNNVIDTVAALRVADDREGALSELSFQILTDDLRAGSTILFDALGVIRISESDELSQEDYSAINKMMIEETGHDLVTIIPDLQAMGLIKEWAPKRHEISLSSLAHCLLRESEGELQAR